LEQALNPRLEFHHLMPGQPAAALSGSEAEPAKRPTAPPGTLLEVRDVSIHYLPGGQDPAALPAKAVQNVSFTLRQGELLGLVGESGCGKTTLMLSLMQLLPPTGQVAGGQILFNEQDLARLSERDMQAVRWKGVSMVFQGAMNALNPVRTVGEQIAEAIRCHQPELPREKLPARVGELLNLVGISKQRREHYPHQYSGGMRQRAMIAMALACNPQIVIADEPTTALDVMIQAQILELLSDLRRQLGLAIIFVTHDLGVVAEMCDRVLVMYAGRTAEYAAVDTIYNAARHPYTQELLKAFPDLSRPERRLAAIPGFPPRLDALPPGCLFAPRCPQAFERCHRELPRLHSLNGGQVVGCHLVEARS
jgi:peptide/nickel transport system ATP-binding protein